MSVFTRDQVVTILANMAASRECRDQINKLQVHNSSLFFVGHLRYLKAVSKYSTVVLFLLYNPKLSSPPLGIVTYVSVSVKP